MSGIRVVVVDDEALARGNLTVLLRRDPAIEVVHECGGGAEALSAIRSMKPDLVFLDVEMPECDGFDVLEMLGADVPPAVVFVTAYDAYAIRAFDAGALDYLLKPFDDARFERALERAKQRAAHGKRPSGAPQTLVVKSAGHVAFVSLADVDWIAAADYYSRLHAGNAIHVLRRSMTDLAAELDPSAFCRIHRSTIVKLARVRGLEASETGDVDVVLEDGTRLPVSRRYRKELKSRLNVRDESG